MTTGADRALDGSSAPARSTSISLLVRILARAVKSGIYTLARSPAIDPELKVEKRKPAARRHLEADDVLDLLAAASELDCAEATAIWIYRRRPHPSPERHLHTTIVLLTLAGSRNQETAWIS